MHFKRHAFLTLALISSAACAAPSLIVVNANVFTADPTRPRAEAVAVENGVFSAVGSNAEIRALADASTRIIDAGGRLATPGLIEAHVHLGSSLPSPPLAMPGLPFPGPTPDQALAAVAAAAKTPGDWISAWIGPLVARDQRNWRMALDAVAPDRPVLLRGFWGHTAIVNSAALQRIGIAEDVVDPIGGQWGRDAAGRLNGRADEGASPVPEIRATPNDPAKLATAFRAAAERYVRWGVTSIHLMNSGKSLEVTLDTLTLAKTPQKWTVYSWATEGITSIGGAWTAMDEAPKTLPPRVRVDGPKWMLDGTPVEQNALQREPYPGRPDWRGRSNYSDGQLREILQSALRRPEQMALHVVGTAETDRVFAMMESLAPASAWRDKRVRIEHGDGIRADTLAQAVRLGVVVIQNPTHFPPAGTPRRPERPALDAAEPAGSRGADRARVGRWSRGSQPLSQHHAGKHLRRITERSAVARAGLACVHGRRGLRGKAGAQQGPGQEGHGRRPGVAIAGHPHRAFAGAARHEKPADTRGWRNRVRRSGPGRGGST